MLYNDGTESSTELEELALKLFESYAQLEAPFKKLADNLVSIGNMAQHLLEFLSSLI